MKTIYVFLACLSLSYIQAQVTAYPTFNNSRAYGAQCVDLRDTEPAIVGHQINVSVSYHLTISDAENNLTSLERWFSPSSNPQTVYARVSSTLNSDYDVAPLEISWTESFPPPGITPCDLEVCDLDNSGSETIYLDRLRCAYHGYGYPTAAICSGSESEVVITYYLTETDANAAVNAVSAAYELTETTNFYRRLENTANGETNIENLITVSLISCTEDTDMDGIPDLAEDASKDLNIYNDDTDQDGILNYLDPDDDGDGILTIDEDYNNNGTPLDDDSNGNGIPDYLENSVTLSAHQVAMGLLSIYPNPVKDELTINSDLNLGSIKVYSVHGKLIQDIEPKTNKIDLSSYRSGIYFIEFQAFDRRITKKIIKD